VRVRRSSTAGSRPGLNGWRALERRDLRYGVALVAAGFLLRLLWFLYARPYPVSDFGAYYNLAGSIVEHGRFGFPEPNDTRTPGYPLVLAAARLFSSSHLWLSAVNVVLSTAVIPLIGLLAWQFLGRRDVAYLATGLAAFYPTFVFYSPVLASEHLFIPLILAGLVIAQSRHWSLTTRAVLVGAVTGYCALVRAETLFLLPGILLALLWADAFSSATAGGRRASTVVRRAGKPTAIFVASFCLVIAPWVIRNNIVVGPGTALSTTAGVNFYWIYSPDGYGYVPIPQTPLAPLPTAEQSREGFRIAIAEIRENPAVIGRAVVGAARSLYRDEDYAVYWSTRVQPTAEERRPSRDLALEPVASELVKVAWPALATCALLALLGFSRWPLRARAVLLTLIVGHWAGFTFISVAVPRYRLVIDVLLCIFAAAVISDLLRIRQERATRSSAGHPEDDAKATIAGSR
jgi:hypothetical protein